MSSANSSDDTSIADGDFVLITGGDCNGKRGFVREQDPDDLQYYRVAVDDTPLVLSDDGWKRVNALRRVHVGDLQLLRKEWDFKPLNVFRFFFSEDEISCHGVAASTSSPLDLPFTANSAYGRLHLCTVRNLPRLRSASSVFKDGSIDLVQAR
jgi:hypothetical protein